MTDENQEEEFSRGMVVVAHADDAEFGCSGTVAKWCREGWDVVYVLCTDGSKGSGDREITGQELAAIRREEQSNAGKVLGLKAVVFLDNEDSVLRPTLELRKDITREIRRHKPDILVTTYPIRSLDGRGWGIGHPDHMAAGEAAMSAVFPTARDHLSFPELLEEGLEPHKVAEVWVMGHPEPDHWVDVSEDVETSIRALFEHTSQLGDDRSHEEIDEMMRKGRNNRAIGHGMDYAEAFRRIVIERGRRVPPSAPRTDRPSS
jgi:LmbE family N-acetylglucosaminyl deacetylase